MSAFDSLNRDLEDLIEYLKRVRKALIVFSDDGDGVSSAYLLTKVLDEFNIDYRLMSLDKAFPEAIKEIFKTYFDCFFFLDIGGAFYHFIPRELYSSVVVIDHHTIDVEFPEAIKYINPFKYGFPDEESPVSSIITYFLLKKVTREAPKDAWAALIGFGESPYDLKGINWRVAYEGIIFGNVKRSGKSLSIYLRGLRREFRSLYRDITLVSSAGYFDDLPLEVIAMFRCGEPDIKEYVNRFREIRLNAYSEMTRLLEEGMFVKEYVQWFEDYKGLFYDMGTRIFDSYVSYVSHQARLYDKNKYIIGISSRKPYIPGLGSLGNKWLNIAVRVSKKLEFRILNGYSQPVSALIEAASYSVGGIGYGYQTNGSCIIPYDSKEEFLNIFNELAGG